MVDYGEQSLLQKDDISFFVFKKCERISSALYIVSDLVPHNDPVHKHLRDAALSLVTLSSLLGSSQRGDEHIMLLSAKIAEVISALTVASLAGLVSTMNQDLIIRELRRLLEMLKREEEIKGNHARAVAFESGFFGGSLGTQVGESNNVPQRTVLGSSVWTDRYKRQTEDNISNKDKVGDLYNRTNHLKRSLLSNNKLSFLNKENRRAKILDVLKRKGRVNVKDVSAVIVNCSEKTIQRELIALVAEGVLKKEGERRWSTYVLAG